MMRPCENCGTAVGREHARCPDCRGSKPPLSSFGSRRSETPEYDPRYERAQSVDGAKARYVAHDLAYDERDLERDLDRLLSSANDDAGEAVDRPDAAVARESLLSGGEVVGR